MILHHICSCFKPACSIMFDYVKPTMWGPPVISWFISPSIYSYLRTINHSDIGVMFTNLAIERGPHIFHHFPFGTGVPKCQPHQKPFRGRHFAPWISIPGGPRGPQGHSADSSDRAHVARGDLLSGLFGGISWDPTKHNMEPAIRYPICSMFRKQNNPNVGIYSIHGTSNAKRIS